MITPSTLPGATPAAKLDRLTAEVLKLPQAQLQQIHRGLK
jgi:hypothetical protein